ncbi:MAG: hypothetical protein EXQ54_01165 [Acidobacteria bacterium]|nr:hypothetical protein [Acidobacteriota bacterium]
MVGLVIASLVVALSQAPAQSAVTIEVAAPGVTQELELNDGMRAIGRVQSVHGGRLSFRTTAGVVMEVEIAVVRSLHPITGTVVNGEFWPADPNPTRLFFAPTGRTLKKGEAYFGVYEIMLPFVHYGVTDRISIGGGTPLFFGGGSDQPFWFTPKFAVARGRTTDLAVGVLHFVNMGDASVGIAYAVATQGTTDAAFTVGGGYAYASEDQRRAGAPVVMVGAEKRLSRRLKFVTENYWFSGVGLASGGLRFMGERLSADIGLVSPLGVDETFVFPMVNFVWKMR